MNKYIEKAKKEVQRWSGFSKTLTNPTTYSGVPREAIWKKNKATLWYYEPPIKNYSIPILLVYSIINQPDILDLDPENSLIQAFLDDGYEVYLLDFGIPGYEDRELTLNDYVTKYIEKGVGRVLTHSGADEISVMGFCLGGTLAAMHASVTDQPIKNLILSLTPIDFHVFPNFNRWKKPLTEKNTNFDPIFDSISLIPSPFIEGGIRLITTPIYFSPYLSLLNRAYDDQYTVKWSRMNDWTKSHIPISGAALKQLFNDFVRDNKLINGGLVIDEKDANLSNIKANLLVVGSQFDKLVPPEQIRPVMDLVSSKDKTFHMLKMGHASLSIDGKLLPYLSEWLSLRSHSTE
ncbi:alpha/beta fold hydrolase [Heyndrickxia sporothermodurans]|uniref:alpha/beta fold hydrolase n=1 Tax=Heyndrickxia sporothermodurans TaxID=46224 RepID=UPI00192A7D87|nr:alpha/beta fold hydrolase [Heyndrickxia sporothermodurans]MBL5791159.1 alpha/beta fold hydrolase [Heyndrickxia sporothermodurans]